MTTECGASTRTPTTWKMDRSATGSCEEKRVRSACRIPRAGSSTTLRRAPPSASAGWAPARRSLSEPARLHWPDWLDRPDPAHLTTLARFPYHVDSIQRLAQLLDAPFRALMATI